MKCFSCLYFESHRCRNEKTCPPGMSFVEYTGSTVRQCLEATIETYQDGYIHCPILESTGCKRCMERFGDGSGFEPDEDQNYERKPRWQKENGMRDCGLPKEVESQCCLNRGGMCTLDTADFGDIDRAAGMRGCGFIGVNDRYLLWKYGVPYKELICENCSYYEAGEHSWGICTNETIKPHPKGFTENGEKKYTESKEYYNGAHACKNFVKKGSEKVTKKAKHAIEQKSCQNLHSSCGGVGGNFFIECKNGIKQVFGSYEKFCAAYDICLHHPETCTLAKDREMLTQLIGKEIRTHYNTGGIVTNICGPHDAYGLGSWTINYTEDGKKRKNPCIINSIKVENGIIACDGKPLQIKGKRSCGSCSYGHWFSGDNTYTNVVSDDGRSTIKRPCEPNTHYCYQFTEGQKKIAVDKDFNPDTAPEWCPLKQEPLNPKPVNQEVNEEMEIEQKTAENDASLPENVTKTDKIVIFDYSTVDDETGAFLQEKAIRISEISGQALTLIGHELKEAQERLSRNRYGCFEQWFNSLGYQRDKVYRLIQRYDLIVANCDKRELIESLPLSLTYEISKPSALPETREAVLKGDITTHKQFKELEEKLRKKEQELESAKEFADQQAKYADEHMMRARTAEFELEKKKKAIESLDSDLQFTQQQLDQAKRNSDPAKIQELGQIISDKQREIDDLRQQLKDKPIEATASRVVEKLPDDVQEYLSSVNDAMRHMQNFAKVNQVLNLIVGLSTDELQSWAMMMNNRKAVDDDEESENLELLDTAIQSLQDMMEDYRNGGCED